MKENKKNLGFKISLKPQTEIGEENIYYGGVLWSKGKDKFVLVQWIEKSPEEEYELKPRAILV